MSGYEATDGIQPQNKVKCYKLAPKRSGSHLWAVTVLFAITVFLCVNNFMLLRSYKEMKNDLGGAYERIDTINTAKSGLTEQKDSLAKQIARLASDNSRLREEYARASRGTEDISKQNEEFTKQIENMKRLNSELQKKNQELVEDNIALQNSLKIAASAGVKPQNYTRFGGLSDRDTVNRGKYAGEFLGTAYTPSEEECGNNKGITSSGLPIIPGVSIAVDLNYWPYGTVFYIKGLGYVVAMDTGSAIKGKYRFDFSVLDKRFANLLGTRKWDVYLVRLGSGKVGNIVL